MPLAAIRRDTEEYFYIGDYTDDQLKEMKDAGVHWDCRDCGGEMIPVAMFSTAVITHFRHVVRSETCWFTTNPESEAHLDGKRKVLNILKEWPEYAGYTFELEKTIDVSNGHKAHRRIDVAAISPSGEVTAHEIQLSYQAPDQFERRTKDYYRAGGIKTFWWVGGACDTSSVLDWLQRNTPEYGVLRVENKPRTTQEWNFAS